MQARLIQHEAERALAHYRSSSATCSANDISDLSNLAVARFFDFYKATGAPLRAAIELLCEINASDNPIHASIGLEALFPRLIEKLNDAFFPPYCQLYDRVFTQVISFFRRLPEGERLDQALNRYGLHQEAAVLRRKRNLNRRTWHLQESHSLKKILFLSRVTIGADVAVTSVLMAHLRKRFPAAEFVLIGSPKLQQLYGSDPRIRVRQIEYGRRANLLSRLESWLQVVDVIEDELAGLNLEDYYVIDPDSRLTQLGLLPVLPKPGDDQRYLFFASRSYSYPGNSQMGQLTAQWIRSLCNDRELSFPFVSIPPDQSAIGRKALYYLGDRAARPIVCLSFGVGGNAIKRVSEQFEIDLVLALSNNARLILDCGATLEELEQANRLLSALAAHGKIICSIDEPQLLDQASNLNPDVLTWRGSLGTFASLIANSNLYIGYDSAGQHIAAALNVPTLTIFVNSGSDLFHFRWQPYGQGRIKTIHLTPSQTQEKPLLSPEFLSQVLQVQAQLLLL